MELHEITNLFEIDDGAPMPVILANDNGLVVAFNGRRLPFEKTSTSQMTDEIVALKFTGCSMHTFGIPGNETLHGHPYYSLGLRSSSFFQLHPSDLIKRLEAIEKVHDRYDATRWLKQNHYIITFHDTLFECVARGFEILDQKKYDDLVGRMLNDA